MTRRERQSSFLIAVSKKVSRFLFPMRYKINQKSWAILRLDLFMLISRNSFKIPFVIFNDSPYSPAGGGLIRHFKPSWKVSHYFHILIAFDDQSVSIISGFTFCAPLCCSVPPGLTKIINIIICIYSYVICILDGEEEMSTEFLCEVVTSLQIQALASSEVEGY